MNQPKDDFLTQIYEQVDATITEMSSPDYEYPKALSKGDWLGVFVVLIVSLACIFAGYFIL